VRGFWLAFLAVAATALCARVAATSPQAVTSADYARAERFLSWNQDRFVVNADIQHHWIDGNRFWYPRTGEHGAQEFVLFDARTASRSRAFDQAAVAASLARATQDTIDAAHLPFTTFRYADQGRSIQFHYGDRLWECPTGPGDCSSAARLAADFELLSPNERWAAFVRDHNLWIRSIATGQESALTTDGVEHFGYAEAPGYSTHAVGDMRHSRRRQPQIVWSPDSRQILTHRLDERSVADAFLIQSVPDDGSIRPRLFRYKYPMPGDPQLAKWRPVVFDVASRRQLDIATAPLDCLPQTPIEKRDAWWSTDSRSFFFLERPRDSRYVSLKQAHPDTGVVREILRETHAASVQTNANNVFDFPLARTLSDGKVLWYSQRDGWGHLYLYDARGALIRQLTRGAWAVRDVVRIDEGGRKIFFMASGREAGADPYEQQLYRIGFDGSGLRLLTPEQADHGRPHPLAQMARFDVLSSEARRAAFSPSGKFFVDSYSRPDLAPTMVLRSADGRLIAKLEEADISRLQAGGFHPVEPFRVLAADGVTELFGNLYRPSTFSASRLYPVIDAIYPGPQAIRSGKRFTAALFNPFEAQSLAELGFIVVTIDGRGTPHRSREFLEHAYGKLREASDLDDHMVGIQALARRYPYMDLSRVGIDGVSGGGLAAAYAVMAHADFYKVAVAAEGPHDLRGYLAGWADSFGGTTPAWNALADSTPPLASRLTGKLLLMHGELDDNVPPTSTLRLVDALVKANKDFELLILPNADHAAFATSTYFIRRKWDFFVRELARAETPHGYSIQPAG
jgi:dipeptidyl-peptidase 4